MITAQEPVVTSMLSAQLRELHAEIVESDGAECRAVALYRLAAEQIDHLTAKLAEAERQRDEAEGAYDKLLTSWAESADIAKALRALLAAAVDALKPFAKRADYFDARLKANGGKWEDDDGYADDPPSDIYLGHLRAARAALAAAMEGNGG
jgi:hypothetical protein